MKFPTQSIFQSILFLLLSSFAITTTVYADTYEGFTQPEQEIEVGAPDTGILASLKVQEGDLVKQEQILGALDNRVQEASLRIAKAKQKASGELKSAQAQARLHQTRLNRLLPLLARGAAQQAEIDRERADLAIAKAKVQAAREIKKIHALEAQQIQAQIARRTLRSPLNGVVTEIHRDAGELVQVSSSESAVLTVAKINPLLLILHVSTSAAMQLKVEQNLTVRFPGYSQVSETSGKIILVSPVTDAGSDTVKVKVLLNNDKGDLRSGIKSLVDLPEK